MLVKVVTSVQIASFNVGPSMGIAPKARFISQHLGRFGQSVKKGVLKNGERPCFKF